jgi:hypothetical protein
LMPREVASSSPAITQMGWPHLPPPIGGPNGPRSGRHVGRLGEGVGSGAANPDASALCGARLGALRIRAGARRSPRQGAGAGEGKAGTRDSRSAWARCGPTRGRRLRDPGRRGSAQRLHQAALGVRRVAQLLAGLGQGRSARPPPPEARERGPGEGARRGSQGRSARPPRARERGPGEGARRGLLLQRRGRGNEAPARALGAASSGAGTRPRRGRSARLPWAPGARLEAPFTRRSALVRSGRRRRTRAAAGSSSLPGGGQEHPWRRLCDWAAAHYL